MEAVEIAVCAVSVLLWLYWWSKRSFGHWKSLGVHFSKPVPLFGNFLRSVLGLEAGVTTQARLYSELGQFPYAGVYRMRQPLLYLHSPALVEAVLVKDFLHFYNRGHQIDEELDPFTAHLVYINDARWKNLRNKLTPVFSSGKLRLMEEKLIDCGSVLVEYIKSESRTGEALDAREVMSRFATDVIGTIAFGLNMQAIKNPDSEFRKFGKELFKPSLTGRIRLILRLTYPKLLTLLRWKSISDKFTQFFVSVIRETVREREAGGVEGKDLLQLLINIRKQDGHPSDIVQVTADKTESTGEVGDIDTMFTDKMLVANAFVFFVAGFETTASTLGYCLTEIANNQDIQEKIRSELKDVLEKHGGRPTYDALKEAKYLQQVIDETLRKYPTVFEIPRLCTREYRLEGTDVVVKKGEQVMVPIYSLQHDPRYWPDPERFDPDRFSQENKKNIVKGAYLPFGNGPRICIGQRFAMYEMKIALTKIITSFSLSLNTKTKFPFGFNKRSRFLVPETKLWIDFKLRARVFR